MHGSNTLQQDVSYQSIYGMCIIYHIDHIDKILYDYIHTYYTYIYDTHIYIYNTSKHNIYIYNTVCTHMYDTIIYKIIHNTHDIINIFNII